MSERPLDPHLLTILMSVSIPLTVVIHIIVIMFGGWDAVYNWYVR